MSYFEDGDTVPPPFNMIPTSKTFNKVLSCGKAGRQTRSLIVRITITLCEQNRLLIYIRLLDKLKKNELVKISIKVILTLLKMIK